MFHSAAVKLTGYYIAIIMVLSIGCSLALYRVSSNDRGNNTQRQIGYFGGLLGPGSAEEVAKVRARSEGLVALVSSDMVNVINEKVFVEDLASQPIERVSKTISSKSIKIDSNISKDLVVNGNRHDLVDL